jgi:hypothetical protein
MRYETSNDIESDFMMKRLISVTSNTLKLTLLMPPIVVKKQKGRIEPS